MSAAPSSGEMKVHRGKVHKYLGMSLDFTNKGQCIVTMNDYLAEIVIAYDLAIAKHDDGFLPITKQRYETPAPENLFTVNEDCDRNGSRFPHRHCKDVVCD